MEEEVKKPGGEAGIIMELPESNVPSDIFRDLIYAAGKPHVLKYGIDFKVFNHILCRFQQKRLPEGLVQSLSRHPGCLICSSLSGQSQRMDVMYASGTNRVDITRKYEMR